MEYNPQDKRSESYTSGEGTTGFNGLMEGDLGIHSPCIWIKQSNIAIVSCPNQPKWGMYLDQVGSSYALAGRSHKDLKLS